MLGAEAHRPNDWALSLARLEELNRNADAPFRRGSDLFELTILARERERGGESGSDKEMSHPVLIRNDFRKLSTRPSRVTAWQALNA